MVKVRIPDLAAMLAMGQIPEHLRQVALLSAFKEEGDPPLALQKHDDGSPVLTDDVAKGFYDLKSHIIVATVVEPALTQAEASEIPVEDRDMLYAIAMRERDTDALGVRLGVEPLSRWATFRGKHGCPPDCPACNEAVGELSTVDLGQL